MTDIMNAQGKIVDGSEYSLPAPLEITDRETLIDRVPLFVLLVLFGAVLIGIWQAIVSLKLVSNILLPSPAETAADIWFVAQNIAERGYIADAMWVTLQEVLLGFAAASVLGIGLGILVGETRIGQRVVMPYLVAINAMPKVAFAPLFAAWLGFGMSSKVLMAAFIAFFPVIVDTAAGLRSIDRNQLMLFRSIGSSRRQTLTMLKIPGALPFIFAGLKTASVITVVGVIVAEYLGGGDGVGVLVGLSASQLRVDRVFSLIFYLSLMGLALFALVGWADRRIVFWQSHDADDRPAA